MFRRLAVLLLASKLFGARSQTTCDSPTLITEFPFSLAGSSTVGLTESGADSCNEFRIPGLWYEMAGGDQCYSIRLNGPEFEFGEYSYSQKAVSVMTGESCADLSCVAQENHSVEDPFYFSFRAEEGESYRLHLGVQIEDAGTEINGEIKVKAILT